MASNNFISANITPSSDTFREWVDLTNRITFDMEKVVVTTLNSATGGGTTGNAYVNGFFSANTLMVATNLTGANPDDSGDFGTKAATADLTISSNTVQQGNLVAQANVTLSGMNVVTSSNVEINSTSTTFTSNAGTNIFNTPLDINANMDVDNALTDITSTNTSINNGELNIGSNLVVNSTSTNANIAANVALSGANVYITSTNVNITSAGITLGDASSDILTVKANTTLNDELNVKGDVDFDSNLNLDGSAVIDVNLTVAGTTKLDGPTDINANMDVDNALTDITSTNLAVTGTNTTISSNLAIIGNTTQMFGNNVFIGNANTDMLNVASNTFLLDTLDVAKATNLQNDLTVGGATTLNGQVTLGDAIADKLKFIGTANSSLIPDANGVHLLGNTTMRFDGYFDDLDADDLNVLDDATIGDNLDVVGAANVQGSVTLGSDTSDIVRVHGLVNTSIVPDTSGRDLGTTAKRWDAMLQNANTSGSLLVGTTSTLTGAITGSNTINITGAATFGNTISAVNSATFSNTVAIVGPATLSNTISVANNATVTGTLGVTRATTLSNTLAVTGTSTLTGDVTAAGNIKAASANVSGHTNVASIGATGAADFDNNLTVEGTTSLKGDISLGDATGDTITVGGRVGSNWNPSANNSKSLGLSTLRWKLNSETINNSKVLATGNTTVTGFINVVGGDGKLDVAQDSRFDSNVNLSNTSSLVIESTDIAGYANVVISPTLATFSNVIITKKVSLPADTELNGSQVNTVQLFVTNSVHFDGSVNGSDSVVTFGEGSNIVTINSAAGLVISDWKPETSNTVDLGISGKNGVIYS